MIDRLRAGNFDAVVIFTVYSQSPLPAALMCHLAGIPLRLAHCRENPYLLLTDAIPEPEPHKILRHEVRRQLDLVASIHCTTSNERLSLRPPSGARRRAQEKLEELGIYFDTRWVLVHPGASAPSRRYPADGFARAADQLARDHGLKVVFSGTASEGSLVETVQSCMTEDSHSVVGELSLAEYATLVHQAPVLISNNTGPVHIAAALGTPVVVLYAQTNPQHTPWDVPCRVLYHDVPCKFCYKSVCPEGHHDCLRRVPPERIVRAACELMTDRSGDEETVRSLPRSLTVLSSTSN
jgi:lipopolysaccharide heptosyltransferase II